MNRIEELQDELDELKASAITSIEGDGVDQRGNSVSIDPPDNSVDSSIVVKVMAPHQASSVNVAGLYDGKSIAGPVTFTITSGPTEDELGTLADAVDCLIVNTAEIGFTGSKNNDLVPGDYAGTVVGSISNGATPPVMLKVVLVNGPPIGTPFAVTLAQSTGSDGTQTAKASWTYNVTNTATGIQISVTGTPIDPTVSPHLCQRPSLGKVLKATAGLAYRKSDGSYVVASCNEVADLAVKATVTGVTIVCNGDGTITATPTTTNILANPA
jgi:hypothetical protein